MTVTSVMASSGGDALATRCGSAFVTGISVTHAERVTPTSCTIFIMYRALALPSDDSHVLVDSEHTHSTTE